jgi:hypothetical protein
MHFIDKEDIPETFTGSNVPPSYVVKNKSDTLTYLPNGYSSMTYHFEFNDFLQGLVRIHATKIYADITLRFINQNSTPCLVFY